MNKATKNPEIGSLISSVSDLPIVDLGEGNKLERAVMPDGKVAFITIDRNGKIVNQNMTDFYDENYLLKREQIRATNNRAGDRADERAEQRAVEDKEYVAEKLSSRSQNFLKRKDITAAVTKITALNELSGIIDAIKKNPKKSDQLMNDLVNKVAKASQSGVLTDKDIERSSATRSLSDALNSLAVKKIDGSMSAGELQAYQYSIQSAVNLLNKYNKSQYDSEINATHGFFKIAGKSVTDQEIKSVYKGAKTALGIDNRPVTPTTSKSQAYLNAIRGKK
jgi:hypothetical protein